jgi:hypothetical protein
MSVRKLAGNCQLRAGDRRSKWVAWRPLDANFLPTLADDNENLHSTISAYGRWPQERRKTFAG